MSLVVWQVTFWATNVTANGISPPMHCSLRATCLQSFWHARYYEQTITARTLQSLHHNLIQSIYAPLLHDHKWSLVAPLEGSHCLQLFFFSATHYFILFVSLLRPHRRLFLQRGLFSHVLRQIIFRARIMFLQRLILGFVWTHVMQCKHRFTPGIDGTSATFAASLNLPSHFPRVRRVTFFYPSAAFRTFLGGCLVSATSVQKAIVMSTDCCKASNLFCMFVQSW